MKTSICLFLAVITFTSAAVAQSTKDKIEISVQSTSLTLFEPDFPGDRTQPGLGGRVTYNFNRSIAAEAEVNFFPQKEHFLAPNGDVTQVQFGVKAGKRFKKFGLFAKARPGFLSIDDFFSFLPGPVPVIDGVPQFNLKVERTNLFTMDIGGVLEMYPSRRIVVRFEAGDTVIRYPERFDPDFFVDPPVVRLTRPAKFTHNFQFTAGVGFRLGDFPADDGNVKTSVDRREQNPRFEVGAQFTSMSVASITNARECPACLSSDVIHTEPGFGTRFTFNLTENIALEAEGNFYTREILDLPNPSGYMFQGQFGAKAGKRFDRWGLFGKARPGFVGFTRVSEVVGSREARIFGETFVLPVFGVVKKFYPSMDIGGVAELYISRRWMARFDFGDTIIRWGALRAPLSFSFRNPVTTRPRETHHNFQVTSGIGFRF
jgi:Outer membrane protein beta-barrel domain